MSCILEPPKATHFDKFMDAETEKCVGKCDLFTFYNDMLRCAAATALDNVAFDASQRDTTPGADTERIDEAIAVEEYILIRQVSKMADRVRKRYGVKGPRYMTEVIQGY